MIKKILVVVLTLCLVALTLTYCAIKSDNSSSPSIVDDYEDNKPDDWYEEKEEQAVEIKTIENSNSWTFEGNGDYQSLTTQKTINMYDGSGTLTSSGFLISRGNNYNLSFDINASSNTTINIIVYDSSKEYVNQTISVSPETKRHTFSFSNNVDSYDTTIRFNINDVGGRNSIVIGNLSVESDYRNIYCKTNQLGYLSNLEKKAAFYNCQGDYFSVYDSDDNLVYTGPLTKAICNENNGDWLQIAYFKEIKTPGVYYLKGELGSYSKNFVVGDDIYNDISNAALKFIYTQRCGQAISFEESQEVYHNACHTDYAIAYGDNYKTDVSGGWHDAGDYGRYLTTANKVMADLLFSYIYTQNNSQEILDEAKYGVTWALKCQRDDGSVFNKITTQIFAENVLPENDKAELYAMYPWTLTTASFAGVTGLSYLVFKDIDLDFANRCLDAHNRAIEYLKNVRYMLQENNPDSFATGEYRDPDESDERLFAYAVNYYINRDYESYELCEDIIDDALKSSNKQFNCKIYGVITLLSCLEKDSRLYQKIEDNLRMECDNLVDTILADAYSYPYKDLNWGSNSHLCDACNKLILAYYALGNEQYLDKASETMNYIMGLNALDMCFVYDFGDNCPKTTHHRVANIRGSTIKGALAGGVDQVLEEGNSGKYIGEDIIKAKRFVDRQDCYTNVEPAIYYNSPLVLSLQLLIDANRDIKQ